MAHSPEALLNVRVLDQNVVDELSRQLAMHLEQATRALEGLSAMLARSEESRNRSVTTAGELQQRLQLGGQLLRALTEEIERAEPMTSRLAAHADSAADTTAALQREQQSLRDHVSRATDEIDRARREADRACRETSNRTEQATARLDASVLSLEDSRRAADAARQLLEVAARESTDRDAAVSRRADDMERRVDSARRELDGAVADLKGSRESVEARSQALVREFERIQSEMSRLEAHFAEQNAAVVDARTTIDTLCEQRCAEIEKATAAIEEQKKHADTASDVVAAGLQKFQSEFSAALVYLENRKRELERIEHAVDTKIASLDGATDRAIDGLDIQLQATEATRSEVTRRVDEMTAMREAFTKQIEEGTQSFESRIGEFQHRSAAIEQRMSEQVDSVTAGVEQRVDEIRTLADQAGRHILDVEAERKAAELALEAHSDAAIANYEGRVATVRGELESYLEGRMTEVESASKAAESSLEAHGNTAIAEFERRVADVHRDLDEKATEFADSIETRVVEAGAEIRAAELNFDTRQDAAVAELHRRLDDARTSVSAYAEELRTSLEARVKELEGIAERTEDRLTEVEANSRAAEMDIGRRQDTAIAEIERHAQSAREQISEQVESDVGRRIADLESLFEEMIDKVGLLVDAGTASTEAVGAVRSELENTGKRLASIEATVESRSGLGEIVDRLRTRLDETNEQLDGLTAQLDAVPDMDSVEGRIGSRVDEIIAQSREAVARFNEQLNSINESMHVHVGESDERAQTMTARIASCQDQLSSFVLGADERHAAQTAALRELEQTLHEKLSGLEGAASAEALSELEGRVGSLMRRIETAASADSIEGLDGRIGRLTEVLETTASADSVEALESLLGELADRVGDSVEMLDQRVGELREPVEHATKSESVGALNERLGQLAQKMDEAASGEAVSALDSRVEELAARMGGVRQSESMEAIDSRVGALEERIDEVAAGSGTDEAEAELRGRLAEVESHVTRVVEQVDTEVASAIERVEATQGSTREALDKLEVRSSELSHELSALRTEQGDVGEQLASDIEERIGTVEDQLTGALGRMESEIAPAIARLDAALTETTDLVHRLETGERDLRTEIAEARGAMSHGAAEATSGPSVHGLRDHLSTAMQAIDANRSAIAELRDDIGEIPGMREQIAQLSSETGEPHAAPSDELPQSVVSHVQAAVAQVERRFEPALEILETQRTGAEEAVTRMEEQLQDLQSQLEALGMEPAANDQPPRSVPGSEKLDPRSRELLQSPGGRRVTAFVSAINSGQRSSYEQFIKTNYANASMSRMGLDQRLAVFQTLHSRSQGISVRHLHMIGDEQLRMIARTNADGWEQYVFTIRGPEAGIDSITVDPIEAEEAQRLMQAA